MENAMANLITKDAVEERIHVIRGKQVMLDRDLAELYGVETKRLNEQVRRNIERFPEEFCFQLSEREFENWRSQFATSNSDKIGLRRAPYAFTEQGVAMLSGVLRSPTAVAVSIQIMNAFVQGIFFQGQIFDACAKFESFIAQANKDIILIDGKILYHIGASLKDLGKKCFAFEVLDSSLIASVIQNL